MEHRNSFLEKEVAHDPEDGSTNIHYSPNSSLSVHRTAKSPTSIAPNEPRHDSVTEIFETSHYGTSSPLTDSTVQDSRPSTTLPLPRQLSLSTNTQPGALRAKRKEIELSAVTAHKARPPGVVVIKRFDSKEKEIIEEFALSNERNTACTVPNRGVLSRLHGKLKQMKTEKKYKHKSLRCDCEKCEKCEKCGGKDDTELFSVSEGR